MNKHKRSKQSPLTRIWRRKAKRVSSNSKEKSERIPSGMTNNKMTNLTTKPHTKLKLQVNS